MFKNSLLLLSALLAAGVTACHHDNQPATTPAPPAVDNSRSGSASPDPSQTPPQPTDNSYDRNSNTSDNAGMVPPGGTIVGQASPGADPSATPSGTTGNTATPGKAAGSGKDTDVGKTGNDVNKTYNTPPDTSSPTMTKDVGSGANTGKGSNARTRGTGTTGSSSGNATPSGTRSGSDTGPDSGSNGSGSADGSGRDTTPNP